MDTLADMAAAVVDAAALVLAAAGAPAVGSQGAAPVAEGAGDTEQRISRTVPGLPRGNRGGAQVSVADVRVHDCLLGAAFADGAEALGRCRRRRRCAGRRTRREPHPDHVASAFASQLSQVGCLPASNSCVG